MTTLVARMHFKAIDGVSGVTSRMANNIIHVQKRLGHINRASAIVGRVGKKLSTGITIPAALAARSIFQTSMAFDGMRNSAQAAGRLTNAAIKPIENLSRTLALSSKFDPTQIMGGAKMLLKSGMSVAAVMGTLAGTVNLAAAGELSLAESADIATNVLTGMNLPMKTTIDAQKSMARTSDVLAYVASNSNTDVRRLGESYKFVAPLASKAGISIEELGASFMVMAQSGISGSEAGVAMRSAIVRMVRPTKGMLGALNHMGISLDDYIRKSKKASASNFLKMFEGSGYNVNPLKKKIKAIFSDESLKDDPKRLIESLNQVIVEGMGDNSVEGQQKISEMVNGYFGSLAEGVDFKGFIAALSRSKAGLGMIARIFDAKQGGRLATLIGNGQLAEAFAKISTEAEGATASMAKILMRGSVGDYHRMTSAYQNMLLTIGKSGVMNEAAKIMRSLGNAFSYLSKRADASFGSINKFFKETNAVDLGKMPASVRAELSKVLADKKLMEDPGLFSRRVAEVISKGVGDGLSQSDARKTVENYVASLTDTSPYLKWATFAVMGLAVLGPLTWAMTNVVKAMALFNLGMTGVAAAGAGFVKLPWNNLWKNIAKSSGSMNKFVDSLKIVNRAVGIKTTAKVGFARLTGVLLRLKEAPFKTIAAGLRLVFSAASVLFLISWPVIFGVAAIAFIITKWEGLKTFFSSFFGELGRQFKRIGEESGLTVLFQKIARYARPAWKYLSKLFAVTDGKDSKGLEGWAKAGVLFAKTLMLAFRAVGFVLGLIVSLITAVYHAFRTIVNAARGAGTALSDWFDSGVDAVKRLLNPLETVKSALAWITARASTAINWFGGSKPVLPSGSTHKGLVSAGRNRPRTIPARARGGDFQAGETLVGENGPELVNFKQPGTVIPNHKIDFLAKARAAALAGALATSPVAAHEPQQVTINLTVNAKTDGTAQEVAKMVMAEINKSLHVSKSAAMHDQN